MEVEFPLGSLCPLYIFPFGSAAAFTNSDPTGFLPMPTDYFFTPVFNVLRQKSLSSFAK